MITEETVYKSILLLHLHESPVLTEYLVKPFQFFVDQLL